MLEISLRSIKMADEQNHNFKPLPMANYSSAIARAIEWLGDRYLLAKPVKAAPSREAVAPISALTFQGPRRRVARQGCTNAPVPARLE
jgi:hypothetical protein